MRADVLRHLPDLETALAPFGARGSSKNKPNLSEQITWPTAHVARSTRGPQHTWPTAHEPPFALPSEHRES